MNGLNQAGSQYNKSFSIDDRSRVDQAALEADRWIGTTRIVRKLENFSLVAKHIYRRPVNLGRTEKRRFGSMGPDLRAREKIERVFGVLEIL